MVRAKFKVDAINRTIGSKQVTAEGGRPSWVPCEMNTVVMSPVYGGGNPEHENSKFWSATPNGQIQLGMVNADAAAMFELGKEYYIDFTPAHE